MPLSSVPSRSAFPLPLGSLPGSSPAVTPTPAHPVGDRPYPWGNFHPSPLPREPPPVTILGILRSLSPVTQPGSSPKVSLPLVTPHPISPHASEPQNLPSLGDPRRRLSEAVSDPSPSPQPSGSSAQPRRGGAGGCVREEAAHLSNPSTRVLGRTLILQARRREGRSLGFRSQGLAGEGTF